MLQMIDYVTAGIEDICQQRGRHFIRERYYINLFSTHNFYKSLPFIIGLIIGLPFFSTAKCYQLQTGKLVLALCCG